MAQALATPDFHPALERDIERLSTEIGRHLERPEMKGASGREVVKESLKTMGASATAPAPAAKDDESALPAYLKDEPAQVKLRVEQLLDVAFHKGLTAAVKEARRAGPFVIDAFHDALTDKLYPELKKRGMIH